MAASGDEEGVAGPPATQCLQSMSTLNMTSNNSCRFCD